MQYEYLDDTQFSEKLDQFIEKENFEEAGKLHLKKGVEILKQGKVDGAYDLIKEAYNFVTCDCELAGHNYEELLDVLKNNKENTSDYKYHFLNACLHFYDESLGEANKAINKYIKLKPECDLGYYMKGRVLGKQDKHKAALGFYKKALAIKRTPYVLYRFGRTTEFYLPYYGLPEMFEAYTFNISSACVLRFICEGLMARGCFSGIMHEYQKKYDEADDDEKISVSIRFGLAYTQSLIEDKNEKLRNAFLQQMKDIIYALYYEIENRPKDSKPMSEVFKELFSSGSN